MAWSLLIKIVYSDWSVYMQIIQMHCSYWMWQVSVHWSKDDARDSLIRIDSEFRNTVQEAGSSFCSFFLKCRVPERPLSAMAARLGPVNPQESLADMFLLKVNIFYMFLKCFNF